MVVMLLRRQNRFRPVCQPASDGAGACLSFLLMIGRFVAEGFGFHIPKGVPVRGTGFSIVIEVFNQIARRNLFVINTLLRARTADAIPRLMGGKRQASTQHETDSPAAIAGGRKALAEEERYMINGVLTLASASCAAL